MKVSSESLDRFQEGLERAAKAMRKFNPETALLHELNSSPVRPINIDDLDRANAMMCNWGGRVQQMPCETCTADDNRMTACMAGHWWCLDCWQKMCSRKGKNENDTQILH